MRRKPSADAAAALDAAQDLIYDAWEAPTAKRRIALAKRALALSPLCADAYVTLAQHAPPGSEQELDLWRRGVETGKAALGTAFAQYVGAFWGRLETRPYMRARCGLARALWARGVHAEAIDHLRDMLRLNPGDNQGVRYILAAWLAGSEDGDDDDDTVTFHPAAGGLEWSWTAALAAFRRNGDTRNSRRYLARAMYDGPSVAAYLAGTERLPKVLPPYESRDPDDEAMNYAADHAFAWRNTPGALDWLAARTPAPKPKARKAATRRPKRGQLLH